MSYHRERCRRKTAYTTAKDARKALRGRRYANPDAVKGVHVYPCPFGKHWHLGHTPSVEGLERLAREIRGLE